MEQDSDEIEDYEHQFLLNDLICAVSGLSQNTADNYLLSSILAICFHGLRPFKQFNGEEDTSPTDLLSLYLDNFNRIVCSQVEVEAARTALPTSTQKSPQTWIEENLSKNTLSQSLNVLLSDEEYTDKFYAASAFLRSDKQVQALFMWLDVVETNELSAEDNNNRESQNNGDNTITANNTSLLTKQPRSSRSIERSDALVAMGNNNSLKVNYESVSKSLERVDFQCVEVVDSSGISERRHRSRELRKSKSARRFTQTRLDSTEEEPIGGQLRACQSLPDIQAHDELAEEIQEQSFQEQRERSRTISQPIRIPSRAPRLTEQNLARKAVIEDSPSVGHTKTPDSVNNATQIKSPDSLNPIEFVRCDEIEIHTDAKYALSPANRDDFHGCYSSSKVPSFAYSPVVSPQVSITSAMTPNKKPSRSFLDPDFYRLSSSTEKYGSASSDFVHSFTPQQGEKIRRRYRKSSLGLEELSNGQTLPTTTGQGYFPKPKPGQSLASFLQTAQFSHTNSELERENSHFSVCDAVISAVEHLKWANITRAAKLANKSKVKRRLKQWDGDLVHLRDPSSSTSFVRQISVSEDSSSITSESSSKEDSEEILSVSIQNLNDHTAYAEWGENSFDGMSAEGVALSLISKFSDKQLPKASELFWNWPGSEFEIGQSSVSIRTHSSPKSSQFHSEDQPRAFLRGTKEWAPPRAQIIFTRHPLLIRKKLLIQQNYRCAGCGMRVARTHSHLYRYCEYLGKLHCTGCHRNQISIIPARVLEKWDFTCFPVSVFSYRLLDQIWSNPLFRITDLSPHLYARVKALGSAREKRGNLFYIKEFILSCRFAEEEKTIFDNIPLHFTDDIDLWSMTDFVAVKQGAFKRDLQTIIGNCEKHILKCELCLARGFVCEVCPRKDVIFPWQPRIRRCCKCGACVHELCYEEQCRKCHRLEQRLVDK